ncbi:UbiH/UbiF family hydroxylase [Martelella alba]|uniref:UbiH/UbiF family hydroxylase n=1 Tax=Martelella alba TaxID=2590451 RepID=A0A506UIQ9_9HYPH|nr:UbiH/UbiF family hydroxylase [Martelella alba]TPW33209.1 UbiH/UbiF family hydroxylase [Martelella alba]
MSDYEIAIVGGGPAGLIAALALSRASRKVALIGPAPNRKDQRTTALMDHSIRFLDRLGLWENLEPATAALSTMRIIDGTKRLIRAPTVSFRAAEIDLPAFGYNVPNGILNAALADAVASEANIAWFETVVSEVLPGDDAVTLMLEGDDSISADMIVGADGRNSKVRAAAGIETKNWAYPQTAIVLNFTHTLPHRNISTEFHTPTGPFTQVPLPGDRSSLVWVVSAAEADVLLEKTSEELAQLIETRMASLLGTVTVEGAPQKWPLSSMVANRFGKGRIAIIGEAAHAFPPIGAQGLNLSLRDILSLTRLLDGVTAKPIGSHAGDRFDLKRKGDVWSRTVSVDILNRSLLAGFLPVQMLRAAGLKLLGAFPPLRQFAMREGVEPLRGFKALLPR